MTTAFPARDRNHQEITLGSRVRCYVRRSTLYHLEGTVRDVQAQSEFRSRVLVQWDKANVKPSVVQGDSLLVLK